MPIDVKLNKVQLSNTIQSGRFLRNILGNLGKKGMKYLVIALVKDNLLGLVSNLPSNAINESERWWYYWSSKTWKKKTRRQISSWFGSTFSHLINVTSGFFISKTHKLKRS